MVLSAGSTCLTGDCIPQLLISTCLRHLSQKGNIMKLFQTYAALVQSKHQFDIEVQKHLRGGYLPKAIIDKLAELHAACFNRKGTACYYAQRDNGAWKFYTSEEMTSANRHDAAQKSWERNVQPYQKLVKDTRGGVRHKTEKEIMGQRDFVLKAFKLLSVTDRKWVLAQVAK